MLGQSHLVENFEFLRHLTEISVSEVYVTYLVN